MKTIIGDKLFPVKNSGGKLDQIKQVVDEGVIHFEYDKVSGAPDQFPVTWSFTSINNLFIQGYLIWCMTGAAAAQVPTNANLQFQTGNGDLNRLPVLRSLTSSDLPNSQFSNVALNFYVCPLERHGAFVERPFYIKANTNFQITISLPTAFTGRCVYAMDLKWKSV